MIRAAQILGKMNHGGAKSLVMEYYRHMDRDEIQFDFIVDEDSQAVPTEELEALGARIYYVAPYQNIWKYHRDVKAICLKNRYPIVHSYLNTLNVFPLFAAKCAGVPVRISENLSMAHKGEWKTIIKEMLRPLGKCFATNLMCCGEDCGRWLFGNRAYDQGRVALFKTPVNAQKNAYDPALRERTRKQYGLEDKIVLGHIARFVPQKNPLFLLDIVAAAYRLNPDVRLLLIGDGVLKNEMMRKIEDLSIAQAVVYLGIQEEVVQLYQAMDAFLLPSLYEGLPIVGIEAQAAGLPAFFSTEVTEETGMTKLAHFLPLTLDAEEWARKILDAVEQNTERRSHCDEIKQAGFDSIEESRRLKAYYLDALGAAEKGGAKR